MSLVFFLNSPIMVVTLFILKIVGNASEYGNISVKLLREVCV